MKKSKNKGITLIGLVITVVIMLILTGITINLLFGDNGLITKTKLAKSVAAKEDAKQVIEDKINTYILEKGATENLNFYDFWYMYNGDNTSENYDPNLVIYLFEQEVAVRFGETVNYESNRQKYKSAVVVYKEEYVFTIKSDFSVAKEIRDLNKDEDIAPAGTNQGGSNSGGEQQGGNLGTSLASQCDIGDYVEYSLPSGFGTGDYASQGGYFGTDEKSYSPTEGWRVLNKNAQTEEVILIATQDEYIICPEENSFTNTNPGSATGDAANHTMKAFAETFLRTLRTGAVTLDVCYDYNYEENKYLDKDINYFNSSYARGYALGPTFAQLDQALEQGGQKVNEKTWLETYPNGFASRHGILTSVGGDPATSKVLWDRSEYGNFEVNKISDLIYEDGRLIYYGIGDYWGYDHGKGACIWYMEETRLHSPRWQRRSF